MLSNTWRCWLRHLWGRTSARGRHRPPRGRAARPALEGLEDRLAPTAVPFFNPPPISPNDAESLVTADLDGDGDPDILVASLFSNTITWFENTGHASAFIAHTISTTAMGVDSVVVGDVDGDGDLDVVAADRDNDTIAWYENTGHGSSFTLHTISTAANGPRAVAVGDVDGDGDLDVVAASATFSNTATITWYENTGHGAGFTLHTISTALGIPSSVAVADVNGDGHLDVLSSSSDDNMIAWYENDGHGSSFTQHVISTSDYFAESVTVGDVNRDGHLDVLSASYFKVAWYENDGNPFHRGVGFTLHTISTAVRVGLTAVVVDLDGDGDLDVLSSSYGDAKVVWYENTAGDGSAFTPHTISTSATGAFGVAAADLDGDGDPDALSACSNDAIRWYRNDTVHRSAVFPTQDVLSTAFGGQSVTPADVNGDGRLDLLTTAGALNRIAWLENNGDGSAFTEHDVSTTAQGVTAVTAADVDGDGALDVIAASATTNTITWYRNEFNGFFFDEHVISSSADGAYAVASADVDGDGDIDVVSASFRDNTIAWYENTAGDGSAWTKHVISSTATGARAVAVADLDGDGDVDVLSASPFGNTIAWYENNGNGSAFTPHTISTTAQGAISVKAADVDGDGDLDVLAADLDGSIAWYENQAHGAVFTRHTISTTAYEAYSVAAADLDGDGDLDVLSASYNDNKVAWYENTGHGSAFTLHTISTSALEAHEVAVADLNGDGMTDVLSTSVVNYDTQITWYPNRGGQFALSAGSTAPPVLGDGRADDVLKVVLTHNGRAGDNPVEMASLDLLFEQSAGHPLSLQAADNLFKNVSVYRDANGDGAFEATADTRITPDSVLTRNDGHLLFTFADGDANVRTAFGSPTTFFVVVQTTPDASLQTPHTFRVTADLTAGSTADDVLATPLSLEGTADDVTSSLVHVVNPALAATGSDTGEGDVHVFDGVTGRELAHFTAYSVAGYNGGARVAVADVSGDGVPDVITAPGKGLTGGALVKVYDGAALLDGTATVLHSFWPEGGAYTGELFVAAGDFNGDHKADIVTGEGPVKGPEVLVFDAAQLNVPGMLGSAHPFGYSAKGGVRVAVGDVNGDGQLDIIAGQSTNGSTVVAVSGTDFFTVLMKKTVSTTAIAGGVFVAAGKVNGNNRVDVIVGLGAGAKSQLFVYEDSSDIDTKATLLKKSAPLYGSTFLGGVRVAAADLDGDGRAEVLTTAGPGLSSYLLRVLNGLTLTFLDAFFSQAPDFTDARYLAASRFS